MNTTQTFVLNKDTADTFRSAWSKFAQRGEATASHHLLQALLLGKDPLRAFTPVTNTVKRANGHDKWAGLNQAAYGLRRSAMQAQVTQIDPTLILDDVAINRAEAASQAMFAALRKAEAI